jgi:hypothetical protein
VESRGVIHATGVRGLIRWHHYTAADVYAFTVHRDRQARWTVSARVQHADSFKLAQSPLAFIVPSKFGAWRFPIRAITAHQDDALLADLGPPTRDAATPAAAHRPAARPEPVNVFDAYGQAYRRYQGQF